ncbi:MAG TPA: alpha-amylase family glycosyl hydrolase [Candidatus Paceibacterota bacterium]|nr:alpha-amylase family glycosyl hydrolase [Verrucomicrobiota bacterium]HRY50499.1 alpha-amylase family glycosyl hydrolase [Candidatus Paceibacterota bacterium]HSA03175.1 alpha-amylase family glycosyl hydrolase [Candidatus Paceibacterota bacterium]
MKFMPIHKLGPHANGSQVHFGTLFPGVSPQDGYAIELRVIHENDQFIQTEPAHRLPLNHSLDPAYGDYWEATLDLSSPGSGAHWGAPGSYVYRYAARKPDGTEIDWIIDPFARQFGVGRHAAFTHGYQPYAWSAAEAQWKTPRHHDLVLYEINVMEFAGSFDRAIERLDYLRDLGITGLSLMPITNITDAIDWGYTPIGYFGVDERFGKRDDFQRFVEAAHQRGIAVLADAIYGHTSSLFAYEYLYSRLPAVPNPIMGSFAKDMFAPSVDWTRAFAEDFFYTVNRHWLEVYHIDGFRYDCVPNYWELGPHFRGYASIVYFTYQWIKQQIVAGNPAYARFDDGPSPLRLIQCAEQLEAVHAVLEQTYSTCTWQNDTLSAAQRIAHGEPGAIDEFGLKLGAVGLPIERTVNNDRLLKSPLQYVENHDQSRLLCEFGTYNPDEQKNPLFEQGDRSRWFKVQPYLIGLAMAKGIPLFWQGQEFCEASKVAPGGTSRTGFLRIVHWEYFYDPAGRGVLTLVRKLLKLRAALPHARDGEHFYFQAPDRYSNHGILLFARYYPHTNHYTLAALNFTDTSKWVPFWFPISGNYREELHGSTDPSLNLIGIQAYAETWIEVPSNYGRLWTHE